MPNRMLRPWINSDKVNSISAQAERFFTRLIMIVDDYGCFYANTSLLKANLFPLLLDEIREADISRWTAECQKAGLIVLYEINSKRYLQILDFKQRLDRAKSKFPMPVNDSREVVNDIQPERKRIEVEVEPEVEGKENQPVHQYETKKYRIEECVLIALQDQRFIEANKTNESELKIFVKQLEKRAEFEKLPKDFKEHFANWKAKNPKELNADKSQTAGRVTC